MPKQFYKYPPLILILLVCSFKVSSQSHKNFSQTGKASFYANKFEGRKTANGEIFHQKKFTAAHKSLPFGTWVKVINLANKRSVIVRINDRGPFIKGRIIDLSKSAAKELGELRHGTYPVRIEIYRKKN